MDKLIIMWAISTVIFAVFLFAIVLGVGMCGELLTSIVKKLDEIINKLGG